MVETIEPTPRPESPNRTAAQANEAYRSLTAETLRDLARAGEWPCISLYVPANGSVAASQKAPIRLKNGLRAAEDHLMKKGIGRAEAEELLAPAYALLDDQSFWQNPGRSLALFRSKSLLRTLRLPELVSQTVVVGKRFHLKPLFPLLDEGEQFHILAISKNHVRLLKASRYSVEEQELGSIPPNLEAAVGADYEEKSLQFHTRTPGGRDGTPSRDAMFHGQGRSERDVGNQELRRFTELISSGLREQLADWRSPLVVASVDRQIALLEEMTEHPEVVGLPGNPDHLEPKALHAAAWERVAPRFEQKREQDRERYRETSDAALKSDDAEVVVRAAIHGRVDTLFTTSERDLPGWYDPEEDRVIFDDTEPAEREDLADRAAVETLLHGGRVHVLSERKIPGGGSMAALFRYPRL